MYLVNIFKLIIMGDFADDLSMDFDRDIEEDNGEFGEFEKNCDGDYEIDEDDY